LTSEYAERYGLRRGRRDLGGRTLALPWVRETATATRLGTYWLGQWDRERLRPKLRAYWDAIGLDKTDCIEIVVPMLTGYGPARFTVRRKVYDLDEGLLSLECEETDLPPLEHLLLGTYRLFRDGIVSLPAVTHLLLRQSPTLPAQFAIYRVLDGIQMGTYHIGWMREPTAAGQYRVAQHAIDGGTAAGRYAIQWTWTPTKTGLVRLRVSPTRTLPGTVVVSAGLAISLQRSGLYRLLVTSAPTVPGVYRFAALRTQTLTGNYAFVPRIDLNGTYAIRLAQWDVPGVLWDTAGLTWDPV
jgi:hypothetical protein